MTDLAEKRSHLSDLEARKAKRMSDAQKETAA